MIFFLYSSVCFFSSHKAKSPPNLPLVVENQIIDLTKDAISFDINAEYQNDGDKKDEYEPFYDGIQESDEKILPCLYYLNRIDRKHKKNNEGNRDRLDNINNKAMELLNQVRKSNQFEKNATMDIVFKISALEYLNIYKNEMGQSLLKLKNDILVLLEQKINNALKQEKLIYLKYERYIKSDKNEDNGDADYSYILQKYKEMLESKHSTVIQLKHIQNAINSTLNEVHSNVFTDDEYSSIVSFKSINNENILESYRTKAVAFVYGYYSEANIFLENTVDADGMLENIAILVPLKVEEGKKKMKQIYNSPEVAKNVNGDGNLY